MPQVYETPAQQNVVYEPGRAAVPGALNPQDQVPGYTTPHPRNSWDADPGVTRPVGETLSHEYEYGRVAEGAGGIAVAEQARDYEVGDMVVVPRSRPGVYQRVPVEAVDPDLVTTTLGPNGLFNRYPRKVLDEMKTLDAVGLLPIEDPEDAFKPEAGDSLMKWESTVARLVAKRVDQRDPTQSALLTSLTVHDIDGILPFRPGQSVAVVRNSGALEDGWLIRGMTQSPTDGAIRVQLQGSAGTKTVDLRDLVRSQNMQQRVDDMRKK